MNQIVISAECAERLVSKAGDVSVVLKSISNKWRLLVLCQLVKGEKSVSQLVELVGLSQSALSQHLAVLRKNKLVNTRRVAQVVFYSIRGAEVPAIMNALYNLYCRPPDAVQDESNAKKH